jgi:hypothetical protein
LKELDEINSVLSRFKKKYFAKEVLLINGCTTGSLPLVKKAIKMGADVLYAHESAMIVAGALPDKSIFNYLMSIYAKNKLTSEWEHINVRMAKLKEEKND